MIRRWLHRRRDEAGFTLLEVMVGAAVMSILTAVAAQGFMIMYRSADRAEAAAVTQTQLTLAFGRIEREVRYAYRVNDPFLTTGGNFAVTFVMPDQNNQNLCVQLELPRAGGTLTRTQWIREPEDGDYALTTAAIANNLVTNAKASDGSPVNPFSRMATTSTVNFDRMKIQVYSTIGLGDKGATRNYDLTLTALNTQDSATDLRCTRP